MAKFNLNLSELNYSEVNALAERLDIPMAEVVRGAVSMYVWITREISADNRLHVQRADRLVEITVPELERLRPTR
jgi:head-tail adaptor